MESLLDRIIVNPSYLSNELRVSREEDGLRSHSGLRMNGINTNERGSNRDEHMARMNRIGLAWLRERLRLPEIFIDSGRESRNN